MGSTHKERASALLIRVWMEGDPNEGERVVIRIVARANVESGEQQSALLGDVASARIWVGQWLSDVIAGFQEI